jgi:hypothetical protein
MINTFQIVAYMPLLSLTMPAFLVAFFDIINSFNMGFSFMNFDGMLNGKFGIFDDIDSKFSKKFKTMGYSTSNIFINMGDVIVFTLGAIVGLIVILLLGCLLSKNKWMKSKLDSVYKMFIFSIPLRFMMESYLAVILSAGLGL